ncbi:Os06g0261300 [Oryza sativa Japonica Group]|uniref:Os06g0261300 protein n=2 Tax=Oryza sativa subsp. japonica TaxID=39947 RepID=A0A0P0WV86_ORYSJ|nr:hypothetical protein EE612_033199 [Oryza sativa]BAD54172.1 unknown protein [Oryza sativa Japonica Group]BAF19242.1 Os06g0261300 [Oryza sativa Japonica Group]BAG93504.1 unnamed protein product [Oryza sativa Japonica Group]BAG99165.1 unnamed protein product [Oryza sativa Japonica Group]|eukprot:NP_001057328.1 Os06g0261300 [Oryza sativa Japonica Group]
MEGGGRQEWSWAAAAGGRGQPPIRHGLPRRWPATRGRRWWLGRRSLAQSRGSAPIDVSRKVGGKTAIFSKACSPCDSTEYSFKLNSMKAANLLQPLVVPESCYFTMLLIS